MTRRTLALLRALLVSTLCAGGLAALPGGAAAVSTGPSGLLDEPQARAVAAKTGKPAEVTGMTNEVRQVFANPDGTFTMHESVSPVRVKQSGGWVPVDATLYARPDGSVSPAATTLDLSLSGGGNVPLLRLRRETATLVLRWPQQLPAPELSGNTATYREVLPDVDLVMRADVDSVSQQVMVKSAQAAANPALAQLRLGMTASGLSMRQGSGGTLSAVDASGREVFGAPAPYMWDSSGSEDAAAVPGGRIRSVATRLSAGELSLIPDQALLASPDTRFPVYIDPSWSGARLAQTQVWSNYPTTSFYNGTNMSSGTDKSLRVGYDATDGKTTRSFFRLDTTGVKGKHILSATLQTYENWSRSCTARQIEVWATNTISTSTTWNNQPTWAYRLGYKSVAKGYSTSSCPGGGLEFNVTPQVVTAAKNNWDNITEGMRASATAEKNKDTLSWKKFNTNPSVTIVYNTVPDLPANLTTEASAVCATGADRIAIGATTPTLRSTVSDADNAVMGHFQWWTLDGTAPVGEWTSTTVAAKTNLAVEVPAGAFADGAVGKWRVRAEDGIDNSEWSDWCEFAIDSVRPQLPLATSAGFPDNGVGTAAMGVSLPVTLSANGSADVVTYEYSLNGDAATLGSSVSPATSGGSVDIAVVPDQYVNWLHVRSVDAAGNHSDVATFTFYAAGPPAAVGNWGLDETGNGSTAVDSSGKGHNAALGGTAEWTTGRYGGALSLDGAGGYAATTAAVVDTSKSFAVTAWVRLASKSRNEVVATQVGSRASAFTLYYSSSLNRWVFQRSSADVDAPTYTRATSASAPVVNGEWVNLVGVYDQPRQQIRLYVDGELQSTVAFTTPWAATGGMQIGRAKNAGAYGEYFTGDIDGLLVYDRALFPGELRQVARLDGEWKMDETSGTVAADATGHHSAAWSATGVTRTVGVSGNAVHLDGVSGFLSTSASTVRTDGSYTIMGWLKPSDVSSNAIAVSQSGAAVSSYALGYEWSNDYFAYQWSLRAPTDDAPDSPVDGAPDLFDWITAGTWVHVAAVYDAAQHQLRLYVNGQSVGELYHAGTWNAIGPLLIGKGQLPPAAASEYFTGDIDDVRTYSGVLSDQEIFRIANGTE